MASEPRYILYRAPNAASPVMGEGTPTGEPKSDAGPPVPPAGAPDQPPQHPQHPHEDRGGPLAEAPGAPAPYVSVAEATRDARAPHAPAVLCLSGGGFRAMLFHAGAIWRLNELGLLRALAQVSSVSGGSITAGMLALAWTKLAFDRRGVATDLVEKVIEPLRALARLDLDKSAIARSLLPTVTAPEIIEDSLRRRLYGDASLADLPGAGEGPAFVINATNVQTGGLFSFSRAWMRDRRIGTSTATDRVPLARAVAASAAFPPFLSPMVIDFDPQDFQRDDDSDLHEEPYTSRVLLTDGGVYDNLALETAFDLRDALLVSDAGAALQAEGAPSEDWGRHSFRAVEIMLSQVGALRKRQLLAALKERPGAYWGIRSELAEYEKKCPDLRPLPFKRERALELAGTPTRLAELEELHQQALIDWGYTVCDAAIRAHVLPGEPRPARTPYCTFGDGEVCC